MTVYPDLAFLVGLLDFGAVFVLSARFLGRPISPLRFWLCAGLSAVLSALAVIPYIPLWAILPPGMGVFLLFFQGKTGSGTVLNGVSGLFVLSVYIALRVLFAVMIFSVSFVFLGEGGYFQLTFFSTVLSGFFAFFSLFYFICYRYRRHNRFRTVPCNFSVLGKRIFLRCYPDSGNFLTDPVSGLPVVIVEYSVLKKAFGSDFPPPMTYGFAALFGDAARVVPFRSVDGTGRMLSAFVPDSFCAEERFCSVVIAVSDSVLECRGRFSGIIGPDLMKGEEL